jgi:hypothetical protein
MTGIGPSSFVDFRFLVALMPRLLFVAFIILSSSTPGFSQEGQLIPESLLRKLLPPGVTKFDFFGDALAVIAFCNFTKDVDQYELAAGMRAFGVAPADQPKIDAIRDRQYDIYRRDFSNLMRQRDFCAAAVTDAVKISRASDSIRASFLLKIQRSGVPLLPGSDSRRQPEKIEVFGDLLGKASFCKISIDAHKFADFLSYMGVQAESMDALGNRAAKRQRDLVAQYESPDKALHVCDEAGADPWVRSFIKQ